MQIFEADNAFCFHYYQLGQAYFVDFGLRCYWTVLMITYDSIVAILSQS